MKIYRSLVVFSLLLSIVGLTFASATNDGKITIDYTKNGLAINDAQIYAYKIADENGDLENDFQRLTGYNSFINILNGHANGTITDIDYQNSHEDFIEDIEDYMFYYRSVDPTIDSDEFYESNGVYYASSIEYGFYYFKIDDVEQDDKIYSSSPFFCIFKDGVMQTIDAKITEEDVVVEDEDSEDEDVVVPEEDEDYSEIMSVQIKWVGEAQNMKPESIVVSIYCNGVLKFKVNLNDDNDWYFEWLSTNKDDVWTVKDDSGDFGFSSVQTDDGLNFVVLNSVYEETLPATGTNANLVSVYAGIGLVFLVIGAIMRKRDYNAR